MSTIFNEDFGLASMVDIDLSNPNLLCDVLLSAQNPSVCGPADAARMDALYDQKCQSPDADAFEICVPSDDGGDTAVDSGASSSGYEQYHTVMSSPATPSVPTSAPICMPPASLCGPIAVPLQNFPSMDVNTLRRRAKSEATPVKRTSPPRKRSSPPEPTEINVPVRVSARSDLRKRRVDQQSRSEMEISEEERLEKNRQSARDCRLRKKRYIESLERRIAEFERRESVLTATIARLEEQLNEVRCDERSAK